MIAALGPLNVLFKLPITEISEVNDHKSVIIFSIITPFWCRNGCIVQIIPLLISATHNSVSLQTSMARIQVLNYSGSYFSWSSYRFHLRLLGKEDKGQWTSLSLFISYVYIIYIWFCFWIYFPCEEWRVLNNNFQDAP